MNIIGDQGSIEVPLSGLVEAAEKKAKQLEIEKNRLQSQIISDWDQIKSVFFWRKCFELIPFEVLKKAHKYVIALMNEGFQIRNPASFCVAHLKKLGYLPFPEEAKSEQPDT